MRNTSVNALKDMPSILGATCRHVVSVIPPLLHLGLIGETSCLVLGGVIGVVVALRSIEFTPD